MTIVTSSYSDWRPRMGVPVRITLGRPRQPHPAGRQQWPFLAELAPAGWYFRAEQEKFGRCYVSQLNRFADDIELKIGWLLDEYGDIALLCYERPGQFCHRRLFAAWWQERTGQQIPEGSPV